MREVWRRIVGVYLRGAFYVLLVTAIIKICSMGSKAPFLSLPNAIFAPLTNRSMLVIAAIAEMAVVGWLFFTSRDESQLRQLRSLAWISGLFVLYRSGLWLVHYTGPCPCLGGALDWLGFSRHDADFAVTCLLGYLLCSYLFLGVHHLSAYFNTDGAPTGKSPTGFRLWPLSQD